MSKQQKDDTQTVDAAYGLVLGAHDGLLGDDRVGWDQWQRPEVAEAALAAARAFLSELRRSDNNGKTDDRHAGRCPPARD